MKPILIIILFFISSSLGLAEQQAINEVCFKDICVQVEIADSDIERSEGLMFREGLADNRGMLFIFKEEGQYGFWMKNMKFPIDIIWLDKERKIVDIGPELQPCQEVREPFKDGYGEKNCASFFPADKVLYVLEVNSGFVRENNIKRGDRVDFR